MDNGKRIVPAVAPVMGQNIEVVADCDPEQFPNGMELSFHKPGALEPLGRGIVRKGCMVAIVPPEMARELRAAMKRTLAQRQASGPGLEG